MLPAKQAEEQAAPQCTAPQGIPPGIPRAWLSFLEDGSEDEAEGEGDEEDEEEDQAPYEPEENMYWVAQDILIAAIGGAQVKRAITARQRQVSQDLAAACSNSER